MPHTPWLIVACLALTGGLAHIDQAQAVLRDPAFEITLPAGVPLPTPTKTGDASGVDYSAETSLGIYRIQYVDLPSANTDLLFENIRQNVRAGSTIERAAEFTHQGHRGLRLYISMSTPSQVIRMDCISVGARLYRVWYISRTMADLETPPVRAFFDSFVIKAEGAI